MSAGVEFEWDETKRKTNLRKHGVDFDLAHALDWGFALCLDVQLVDSEERELWIAPAKDRLYAAVLTHRTTAMRIISLRLAANTEIQIWRKEFHNG